MTRNNKKSIAENTRGETRFEQVTCQIRTLMNELFQEDVSGLLMNDIIGWSIRVRRGGIPIGTGRFRSGSTVHIDQAKQTRRCQGEKFFATIFDMSLSMFEEESGDQCIDRANQTMAIVRMSIQSNDVFRWFQSGQTWQGDSDVDENQTGEIVIFGVVTGRCWISMMIVRQIVIHGVLLIDQCLTQGRIDDRRRTRGRDHLVDQQMMLRIVGERRRFVLRIEVFQGDHQKRHSFVKNILERVFNQTLQLQENTDENDTL